MRYLKVREVAVMLGVTVQNIYAAMSKRVMKHKKIDGIKYTTNEWVTEYRKFLHCKQTHSRYNGKAVFDKEQGFYSVKMVADILRVKEHYIHSMIEEGKIQAMRRGKYLIILKEELEKVKESVIERACKSA